MFDLQTFPAGKIYNVAPDATGCHGGVPGKQALAGRSSPMAFAGVMGRDPALLVCHLQVGAGLPYPSVRGPSGLPITEPSCTGAQELKSSGGVVRCAA